MTHLLYPIQEAPEPWQGGFLKRSINHIIHCRVLWETDITVFAGQAMQNSTVHLPAAAQELEYTISAYFEGKVSTSS